MLLLFAYAVVVCLLFVGAGLLLSPAKEQNIARLALWGLAVQVWFVSMVALWLPTQPYGIVGIVLVAIGGFVWRRKQLGTVFRFRLSGLGWIFWSMAILLGLYFSAGPSQLYDDGTYYQPLIR